LNRDLELANRELASASHLKSQFLANMSHELRTPLNSIIGYSELILDEMYGPLTDKQRDRLQKVHRNGKNLLSLINDILDLSKIEAGRMELDIKPVDIQEMIESVLATVQPLAQEKDLELRTVIPPDLPLVNGDADRLRQIILNLASNAVKFTGDGSITLEAGISADRKSLELKVIDTGIGIPPELQEAVFDEFRQVDNTSTREYGGTGLGLAISRRLARLHGGNVLLSSSQGVGSTFTVILPLPEVAESQSRVPLPGGKDTGPLVLVIDDEADASDLVCDHLAKAGFRVQIVHNGPDGIQMAKNLQPSAITLDIMMPGMDGWQVLQQLRAEPSTASIPVIIVSIVDETSQAADLGPYEYIMKPVNPDRLLDMLQRAGVVSTP
jgi:CheY-like chemotaxis protein